MDPIVFDLYNRIDELEQKEAASDQERADIEEEVMRTRETILTLTGGPVAIEPPFR